MKAAFFDVDYTIIHGSTSIIWMKYLLLRGMLGPKKIADIIYYALLYKLNRLPYERMAKKVKDFVVDYPVDEVNSMSKTIFEKKIRHRIYARAAARIEKHRKTYKIILATAAPYFMVQPLADHLEVDDVIATVSKIKNNKLISIDTVAYGPEKAVLMKKYSKEHKIDLKDSFFYTDHLSDMDGLKLVGNPYIVNPNPKLKDIAKKNNFKVIDFI